MSDNRTKNSTRNIISGLTFRLFSLLMPFIIRTIIIKKLGMDYLGLNSLFTSILQVLSLTELGFSTSIAFSLYKPVQENNEILIRALLNKLKKIYKFVGITILLVGLILMIFLPFLIKGDYPKDINIYILYIIYLVNISISYLMFAHYSVLLTACQRSDIENKITIFAYMIMYICQIIVLIVYPNYYIYIIFLPISTIIINIIRYKICKKMYPHYYEEGNISKEEAKKIYNNIKYLIGHRLSYTVVTASSNIIISGMLGLVSVALYQNYYYIITALISIINIFYSSITASIGNSLIFENKEKNYGDFLKLTFVNVWIVGWMSICLLCLFQPFMILWVGQENTLSLMFVILSSIYLYSWRFKDILTVYKDAAGMWKEDYLKPYVVTIVNIILSLIFIKLMGLNGVILATILSVPVISLPWETHVFFKYYFERSSKQYYLKLLIYSVVILLVAILTYFICSLIKGDSILMFIYKILICSIVPNIILVLVYFRTNEFKWLLSKIKSLIKLF